MSTTSCKKIFFQYSAMIHVTLSLMLSLESLQVIGKKQYMCYLGKILTTLFYLYKTLIIHFKKGEFLL